MTSKTPQKNFKHQSNCDIGEIKWEGNCLTITRRVRMERKGSERSMLPRSIVVWNMEHQNALGLK